MPQQIITLGRGADNTVVLSESNVSTHHARLIIDGDEIVVEDLGSTNGTSVAAVENKTIVPSSARATRCSSVRRPIKSLS
jgi:pSer/pThr/pTyr-binding forkhead associated (FHA) protein